MRIITYAVSTTSSVTSLLSERPQGRLLGEQGCPPPSREVPSGFPLTPAPPWRHPRCDLGFWHRDSGCPHLRGNKRLEPAKQQEGNCLRSSVTAHVPAPTARSPSDTLPPSSVLTGGGAGCNGEDFRLQMLQVVFKFQGWNPHDLGRGLPPASHSLRS